MPEREIVRSADACRLAQVWGVDEGVMEKIGTAADLFARFAGRPVYIISGFRTRREQSFLSRTGRPAAPDSLSTHRSCPATGVDISLGVPVPSDLIRFWGELLELNGLRWGGGSPADDRGIPTDWQHADRGPRVQ